VSEAGCPGIADPGQILVQKAQKMGSTILPFVGPNSIILALMASGLSGQQFIFNGYLPIDAAARKLKLKQLEQYSIQNQCTQIFIETPYRNNQMLQEILATCKPETLVCIGVDITAPSQEIITKSVSDWKKGIPNIHKKLCVFLIMG
jgi:16S rRNA (cytidine1402-2'-O)-methyltransferase